MELVRITNAEDTAIAAQKASDVLRAGGVILYPTDTMYGLGADALSDSAVAKIYAIKGRNEGKPIHALMDSVDTAGHYAEISKEIREKIIPSPITFIFKKKPGLDSGIAKDMDTFGFRVPNNVFCLELTKEFGGPVTGTSANKSGEVPEISVEKILEQLGNAAKNIDLVIDAGILPSSLPSTVVDITSGTPAILREGTIPAEEIKRIFG